jgi:hypothetical protein
MRVAGEAATSCADDASDWGLLLSSQSTTYLASHSTTGFSIPIACQYQYQHQHYNRYHYYGEQFRFVSTHNPQTRTDRRRCLYVQMGTCSGRHQASISPYAKAVEATGNFEHPRASLLGPRRRVIRHAQTTVSRDAAGFAKTRTVAARRSRSGS